MKKVTVTYHLRNMLSPRSTAETCIDLPVMDALADDLMHTPTTVRAQKAQRFVSTICDALAVLQGYDEAVIVDVRYDTKNEELR